MNHLMVPNNDNARQNCKVRPTCQLAVQSFRINFNEINVSFVKFKFYRKQFLLSNDIVFSYDK